MTDTNTESLARTQQSLQQELFSLVRALFGRKISRRQATVDLIDIELRAKSHMKEMLATARKEK